jgi:ABC-type Mn2+/Zn2+ transport system ATPase subunit
MLISLPADTAPSTIPSASTEPARGRPGERASEALLVAAALEIGHDGAAILPPIELRIERGSFWAIIGPNGSGKSTFVRTILGLDRPIRGAVTRAPDLRAAYMPQQATLDPIFPIRVLEFVLMGRIVRRRSAPPPRPAGGAGTGARGGAGGRDADHGGPGTHGGLMGPPTREDLRAARAALRDVRAAELERRLLRDLSGGQRQRVLFARALAADANLYVLDEPTAALDIATEREVLGLISALRDQRGAAIVMITHLVDDGLSRADRALLLDRDHGTTLAGSAAEVRTAPELLRLYSPLHGHGDHGQGHGPAEPPPTPPAAPLG